MSDKIFYRINDKIKISPIVVIDEQGKNLGSMPTFRAKVLALSGRGIANIKTSCL